METKVWFMVFLGFNYKTRLILAICTLVGGEERERLLILSLHSLSGV